MANSPQDTERPIILLADMRDLRCLRDALETLIDAMPGGQVRAPYLVLHARIENLMFLRHNELALTVSEELARR
jgi:hypothetical protein